jgi:hypothetical protein
MGNDGITMHSGDDGFKIKSFETQPPEPKLSKGPIEGPDGMDVGRCFDKAETSGNATGSVPRGDVLESPMDK